VKELYDIFQLLSARHVHVEARRRSKETKVTC